MKLISITFRLLYCFSLIVISFLLFTKYSNAADNHLIINEICPFSIPDCEEGEWIELSNQALTDVNLAGYTISDANIEKKFGTVDYDPDVLDNFSVPAQGFLLLKKINKDFSFTINDDSEKIVLRYEGDIVDQFSYGTIDSIKQEYSSPVKGKSYSYFETGWKLSTPTPGETNIVPDDIVDNQNIEPMSIEEARSLENGEEVTIEGTVTALPGVLSSQYFYIQDGTGGIQIYCYGKIFPNMAVGDSISVTGELSETSNERRVKISGADKIIILNHTEPLTPMEITTSEIGEESEGEFVKTAGIVTETSGDTFYISDGIKEIKVIIRSTTGIDKPKMKKGDQVEVMGIVSQYKDEYRILPIDQDDVKIVASESTLPKAGSEIGIYLIISLSSCFLWNIYHRAKKKLST